MSRSTSSFLTLTMIVSLSLLPQALRAEEDKEKKVQFDLWGGWTIGVATPGFSSYYGSTSIAGGLSFGLDGYFLASKNIALGLGFGSRSFLASSYSIYGYSATVNAGYLPILAELRFSFGPVYFQLEGGYAILTYAATVLGISIGGTFPTTDFSGPAAGATFGFHIPLGKTFGLELFAKYLIVFSKYGFYANTLPTMGITPGVAFAVRF
ncbi:MAG: hypothetical protein JNM63_02080 [Spirochaetia bacterium]|nr:hypothetical protein [Spirochaetia bacterium]